MISVKKFLYRSTTSDGDWGKTPAGVVFESSDQNAEFAVDTAARITVKTISLWRKDVEKQVGTLSHSLEPVTKAPAILHLLMGYRYKGEGARTYWRSRFDGRNDGEKESSDLFRR